jgi:hypothetical protein
MVDFNDTSKPVGEACREDRTLKDASEMEWILLRLSSGLCPQGALL